MLGNVGSAMTMSGLPGLDDEHLAGEDTESNSKKSERKRQREKQRRSDLANAFEELSSLLSRIEPDEDDAGGKKRKRRSSVDGSNEADAADSSGMTRLDVIGRTIEILRRLHRENSELKQSLDQPRRDGGSGDDREVLVMVPTLSAADDRGPHAGMQPPGQQSYYYGHHHHQQPHDYGQYQQTPQYYQQGPPQQQGYYNAWAGHQSHHYHQPPPPPLPPGHAVQPPMYHPSQQSSPSGRSSSERNASAKS